MPPSLQHNKTINYALIVLSSLLLLFSLRQLPATIGTLDFRAYWSTSYLLAHGEDFTDEATLLANQRALTDTPNNFAMKTWNLPWVLVWIMPLTWIDFAFATNIWLLLNIAALLFSITIGWKIIHPQVNNRWVFLPIVMAIFFPSTIVSLMFGQVNILVLTGIMGYLWYAHYQENEWLAGAFLALTTFKPHLVYLVVPLLLLQALRARRWQTLLSFFGWLILPLIIALLLRPTFLFDYFQGTTEGNLLAWETPTLVTYLSLLSGWKSLRLIALILLPLQLVIWVFKGHSWNHIWMTQIGLLGSIITMPFGWSYDFVILLFPLSQIISWLLSHKTPFYWQAILSGCLLATYIAYYIQRMRATNELHFFWFPLVVAAMYGLLAWQHNPSELQPAQQRLARNRTNPV